jgi:hypothetical protein
MPKQGKTFLVSLPKHLARTKQQGRIRTIPLEQKYDLHSR